MTRRERRELPAPLLAKRVLDRLDPGGIGVERARVVSIWEKVAGAEVFSHARGFALRDGELLIFVDSGVWANELAALSEHYRQAINTVAGREAVRSMRFAVSKRVRGETDWEDREASGAREAEEPRVDPVPATAHELAQIRQMASAIHSEDVREAVIRAAIRNLEWQKGIEARKTAENGSERSTGHDSC